MKLADAIQIHSTKSRSPDDVHSQYAQWFVELKKLRKDVEKLEQENSELKVTLKNIPDEVIEEYNYGGDEYEDDCYDYDSDVEDEDY